VTGFPSHSLVLQRRDGNLNVDAAPNADVYWRNFTYTAALTPVVMSSEGDSLSLSCTQCLLLYVPSLSELFAEAIKAREAGDHPSSHAELKSDEPEFVSTQCP